MEKELIEKQKAEIKDEIPAEIKEEVKEEKTSEEIKEKVEEKIESLGDRLRAEFPDKEISDDDLQKIALEHIKSLENYRTNNREANKKIIEVLESEPAVGEIIKDLSNGSGFREALARNFDVANLQPVEGDPDYEAWGKNLVERKKKRADQDNLRESLLKNQDSSIKAIKEFAKENNLSDDEANEFLSTLDGVLSKVKEGNITKEFLGMMKKALSSKNDITKAQELGEIKGRNEKIETIKQEAKPAGDGLPNLTSSQTKEKEPVKVKPDPFNDSLLNFNERRKGLGLG